MNTRRVPPQKKIGMPNSAGGETHKTGLLRESSAPFFSSTYCNVMIIEVPHFLWHEMLQKLSLSLCALPTGTTCAASSHSCRRGRQKNVKCVCDH